MHSPPRGSFIPATRIFDAERQKLETDSALVGYTIADLVRAALGLEPEHPPKGGAFDLWSMTKDGILTYDGRPWGSVVAVVKLLNARCVTPLGQRSAKGVNHAYPVDNHH
jgi:hypothetical protein